MVSERLLPALIGIVTGIALAVMLFVPYVARQYRRRGQLGAGHLALALAAVVYGVSLVAYGLLIIIMMWMRPAGLAGDASSFHAVRLFSRKRSGRKNAPSAAETGGR